MYDMITLCRTSYDKEQDWKFRYVYKGPNYCMIWLLSVDASYDKEQDWKFR